jgi:hypothetical protein
VRIEFSSGIEVRDRFGRGVHSAVMARHDVCRFMIDISHCESCE